MSRVWNFSAGPAVLPEAALRRAQEELLDWRETGASVMEVSHRGAMFSALLGEAEADLRELLAIPENYRVLFLQGGATQQFLLAPLNLLRGGRADYLVTGSWSKKAYAEASKLSRAGKIRLLASTEKENAPAGGFDRLPDPESLRVDENAAYVHLCSNETIHGVEAHDDAWLADVVPAHVPIVADMSSHLLSRPVDVTRYGLIYAGAQKNIGPAGLTLVILRDDLLGGASPDTPALWNYQAQAENSSMLNTPATFSIYMASLVFKWLKNLGGLKPMAEKNRAKAEKLYAAIEESDGFYRNGVKREYRSRMNVPFNLPTPELEMEFVRASESAGFMGLKGHKSVGGIRASLYNAMPQEGVTALTDFMNDFAAKRRHV
ncbi:MAG: 3-phosphoserine/phosphohydroxythreonine transaminase [Zoogloeaceae bacterium]|jgi:phosphoserine aminotransferase|nr:3-phosphoserine/phosphohydroxythreonine transaminase [Zoogloeaceae bacterium]